jgi:hypothetical protein
VDVYLGLVDHLLKVDVSLTKLGQRVVLLSSFAGRDHTMQQ